MLVDNHCTRLERKIVEIRRYANAMLKHGRRERDFRGSPVTSMAEDVTIRAIGVEKMQFAEAILKILND